MQQIRTLTLAGAAALATIGFLSTANVSLAAACGGALALLVSMLLESRGRLVFALRCLSAGLGVALMLLSPFLPDAATGTLMGVVAGAMAVSVFASLLQRSRVPPVSTYALGFLIMGCEPGCAGGQLTPGAQKTLEGVVSRVDVSRLLQCAGAGDMKAVAKCLGARVVTEGLEEALYRARTLAEQAEEAGNEAAGAADMTDEQKVALATDLDAALDDLGVEIAKANNL